MISLMSNGSELDRNSHVSTKFPNCSVDSMNTVRSNLKKKVQARVSNVVKEDKNARVLTGSDSDSDSSEFNWRKAAKGSERSGDETIRTSSDGERFRDFSHFGSEYAMADEGASARRKEAFGLEAAKALSYGFEPGDMVWGKVVSHPWWPGQIFSEAFATPAVQRTKRAGHVLVAFFGDCSYGWFDPAELIPFMPNFAEKSKQTTLHSFVKAVDEAVEEASRRGALGLTCRCRNSCNFRRTNVTGYFSIDVNGYEPGGIYSVMQIKKAREGFQPTEALHFVQQLALNPHKFDRTSIEYTQKKAKILAYRKATYEEFDETYDEAFGKTIVQPSKGSTGALKARKLPAKGSLSDDPAKAGWKRSASDRLEELSAKRLKKINESKSTNAVKKAGSLQNYKPAVTGRLESVKKANPPARVPQSGGSLENYEPASALKPDTLKKAEPRARVSQPGNSLQNMGSFMTVSPNLIKKAEPLPRVSQPGNSLQNMGSVTTVSPNLVKKAEPFPRLSQPGNNLRNLQPVPTVRPNSVKMAEPLARVAQPAMLVLNFPPRTSLPSIAELKAKFARFGPLDPSALRVYWSTSTCKVVFNKKVHAQAAFNYAVRNKTLFGHVKVDYQLRDVGLPTAELSESVSRGVDGTSEALRFRGETRPMSFRQPTAPLKSCLKKLSGNGAGQVGSSECINDFNKNGIGGEPFSSPPMEVNIKNMQRVIPLPPPVMLPFSPSRNMNMEPQQVIPSPLPPGNVSFNLQKVILPPPPSITLSSPPCHNMDMQHLNVNMHECYGCPVNFIKPPQAPPPPLYDETVVPPTNYHNHNIITTTTTTRTSNSNENSDIAPQMLSLMVRCNDLVTELRNMLGYFPCHPL